MSESTDATGSYALDTNVVIALLKGDTDVTRKTAYAAEVYVPSVVLGELYFGACKSTRTSENLDRIEAFASTVSVLSIDRETAKRYGDLKARLRALGRPIPENDIWIAAVATRHDLVLVSRDRHFQLIEALALETW